MSQDKIIDRVRKLLAVADANSGATEEEAATALRMAMELLDRHNLSMDDISARESTLRASVTSDDLPTTRRIEDTWKATLCYHAAPLYLCRVYLLPTSREDALIRFVGKPHNIQVAKAMCEYLIRTVERLGTRAVLRANMRPSTRPKNADLYERSFKDGCTTRLCIRVQELFRARQASTETTASGTTLPALVGRELAEVDEFMETLNLRNVKARKRKYDHNAYDSGFSAADDIGLHDQVHAGEHTTKKVLALKG